MVHIQKFDKISNDLLNLGIKMDGEDKSLFLLCSLPFSYDPLVITLLYGKEMFYEDIVPILISNEQRKKLTEGTP